MEQNRRTLRLVAYTRTSTANGAGGDSLAAQEAACREWAAEHGHDVITVYADPALSGALPVDQRPGLAAALFALEDGEADGLVVHRLDRLARELHVQEAALAHAWEIGANVEVFEAVEGVVARDDPADPHRRFLRQVLGAASELERGLIRARLANGRRRKRERGGFSGGPELFARRYGFALVDGAYEADPTEQAVIERMRAMRDDDRATLRSIADQLNAEGVVAPSGSTWHHATVRRVLAR